MSSKSETVIIDATPEMWKELIGCDEELVEGQTTREISKIIGCSFSTAKRRLDKLLQQGKCVKGLGLREYTDGSIHKVPVYQIKKGALG